MELPQGFVEIDMSKFLADTASFFNLFTLVNGKLVAVFKPGDPFLDKRLEKLKLKGLTSLIISEEDYRNWSRYEEAYPEQMRARQEALKKAAAEASASKNGEGSASDVEDVKKEREAMKGNIKTLFSQTVVNMDDSGTLVYNLSKTALAKPNYMHNIVASYNDELDLYAHAYNVAGFAVVFASALDYDTVEIQHAGIAGLFHDIGKTKLLINPMQDPSTYTKSEYEDYKRHPALGAQMLRQGDKLPEAIYGAVFQHHEDLQGEGFPQGLRKAQISRLAKVVGLANAMDHFLCKESLKEDFSMQQIGKDLVLRFIGKYDVGLIKTVGTTLETQIQRGEKIRHSQAPVPEQVPVPKQGSKS